LANELGPLRTIAIEDGDVDLFPDEVLKLHDAGKRFAARDALLRISKAQPDAKRKARQLHWAEDLGLWFEQMGAAPGLFTLNGVGTKLYTGSRRYHGLDVGVLWFVLLFVPVLPLGAYLVTGEARGWRFYGRIPIPRSAWLARALWAGGIALALGVTVVPATFVSVRYGTVAAYNGFAEPVQVEVGGEVRSVDPHGHVVLSYVPLGPVTLRATTADGRELDRVEVDLSEHRGQTAIFDVAGRDPLTIDWVRWGDGYGDPPDSDLLPVGSVAFTDAEYVFAEPPESRSVTQGDHIDAAWVHPLDLPPDPERAHLLLANFGLVDQARALVDAERRLHPTDGKLAYLAAAHRATFAADQAPAFVGALRDQLPDEVEAHRAYQDFVGGGQGRAARRVRRAAGRPPGLGDAPVPVRAAPRRRRRGRVLRRRAEARPAVPARPARARDAARGDRRLGRGGGPARSAGPDRRGARSAAGPGPDPPRAGARARPGPAARRGARRGAADRRLAGGRAGPGPGRGRPARRALARGPRGVRREVGRVRAAADRGGPRSGARARGRRPRIVGAHPARAERRRDGPGSQGRAHRDGLARAERDRQGPRLARGPGVGAGRGDRPGPPRGLDRAAVGANGLATVVPALWSDRSSRDPAAVDRQLRGRVAPADRAAVYAALAIRWSGDPAGAAFRALARKVGLPQQQPFLRR
jgi:hypothetical protein